MQIESTPLVPSGHTTSVPSGHTRDLMVLYDDPLYRHTRPVNRVEIDIEPEEEGMERVKAAIGQVLARN